MGRQKTNATGQRSWTDPSADRSSSQNIIGNTPHLRRSRKNLAVAVRSARSASKRGNVSDEAVFDVTSLHAVISFVNRLCRDHFDVGHNAFFGAEIVHFLRFSNAADQRAGNRTAPENEVEHFRRGMRMFGHTNQAKGAIPF